MIFELRSYVLRSERFSEYLATFGEQPEVVEVLRPYLRGFWSSESGILNRVMHMYEYRDRAERAPVRAARAQVPVMKSFYAHVLPMLQEQRSVIYEGKVASGYPTRGGVYDRVSISLAPGVNGERFGEALFKGFQVAAALQSHLLEQPTAPVRELLFLLRSASLEQRRSAGWHLNDSGIAAIETDLWLPLSFSPLQ